MPEFKPFPAGVRLLILISGIFLSSYLYAASGIIDHKVLSKAPKTPIAKVQILAAYDGTELAFRQYLPRNPEAILIFYHGAGLHSATGYQHLAFQLAKDFNIAVFTPDIRGQGQSGGERGDAPAVDAFWHDIDSMLNYLAIYHPNLPVYLGGHAGGAALVLNYISAQPRSPVAGLVFLSPALGDKVKLGRNTKTPFSIQDKTTKWVSKATLGLGCRHCTAVSLEYPHPFKVNNPGIVTHLSRTTVHAFSPDNPKMQVRKLRIPFAVWTASKDEITQGGRTKMFFKQNGRKPWLEENQLIKGATHLSVLLKGAEKMGPWIISNAKQQQK